MKRLKPGGLADLALFFDGGFRLEFYAQDLYCDNHWDSGSKRLLDVYRHVKDVLDSGKEFFEISPGKDHFVIRSDRFIGMKVSDAFMNCEGFGDV